ncbi:MAG: D-alanyl-D-alanine carboxypeptidase, partial [Pusillimonas sp.]
MNFRAGLGQVRRWVVSTVVVVAAATVSTAPLAQGLPPELQQAWRATRLSESDVSIVVQELNGPRLVSINADQPRNPASVMKMVTTWTALAGLGPEYRWRTAFYAEGDGRPDEQGSLRGPLYLKAAGDPLLGVEELWSLLRELRLRGIKNLSEVVVDRSVFGAVAIDTAVFDGAPDRPYNASPDALVVGLGAARLSFQPDPVARKWVPVIDPPSRNIRVEGEVLWSDQVCPGSPSVGAVVLPAGGGATIQVSGTAAGSCGEFSVYRLALSQPLHFETVFRQIWSELGGTLAKGMRQGVVPSRATLVAWHDSESLSDMIRHVNKFSNNVMARLLLLTLGAEELGRGATSRTGAQAALRILQTQGVDTRGWVVDNGAGLSRDA